MKVGDLLKSKDKVRGINSFLIVLGIKEHPTNSKEDRILLQWMPRNGGKAVNGEFSRLMVESKYKVV